MKKLLLFALALLTLNTVNANLLLHESFDYTAGRLDKGEQQPNKDWNLTDWYYTQSNKTDYVQVAEGSLSYEGYVTTATGNKAVVNTTTSGNYAERSFATEAITSGSIYFAALINVESLHATDGKEGYFMAFANSGGSFAPRLYMKTVGDKFQLGIMKSPSGTYTNPKETVTYGEPLYSTNTTYLVVMEYEVVEGEKNDIARLYVNPTATEYTAIVEKTHALTDGSISSVTLLNSSNAPQKVYIDEIKVSTQWADLFEVAEAEPEIVVTPTSLGYLQGNVGGTYTKTFTVKGTNLKEDITLSSDNTDITLDKTTISKEDAASEVTIIVTIAPTKAYDYDRATITIVSGDAKATVAITLYVIQINKVSTIAELNALTATASGYDYVYAEYTGEAIVTYKYMDSGYKLYLQDATAGVFVNDSYWSTDIARGDKVSNFVVYADAYSAVGGMMYIGSFGDNIDVLSHDNEVTPKVVTLAELQANPADYLCQLVKVEGVTFANTGDFASGDEIKQGETTATISLIAGNELLNTHKPTTKVDIVGLSSNTKGSAIRVRDAKDVIAVSTAIDNIAADGAIEIYTVSGMRVSELQPGVNIIRQGNKTYKVIR